MQADYVVEEGPEPGFSLFSPVLTATVTNLSVEECTAVGTFLGLMLWAASRGRYFSCHFPFHALGLDVR